MKRLILAKDLNTQKGEVTEPLRHRTTAVLLVCGATGAMVGLCFPELQDAIEAAQIHAGVVPYDAANPFSVLAIRLWSLQLQIPALLMHWGASERAVSAAMSAAMGAVSFQALGITVLAAGGRPSIACLAPGAIVAFGLARGGIVYPVLVFGTVYTWGAIGLSANLLAVALLAAGALRLGAFLLAVLPAVHAGLGIATWAVVGLVALGKPSLRADLWHAKRWLILGGIVTAASVGVHAWRLPQLAPADWAQASAFTDTVLKSWDTHRQLGPVRTVLMAGLIGATSLCALILWRRWLTPRSALLPQFVLITASVGAVLHLARALPDHVLPQWVWVLMPGRLMNFAFLSAAALAVGLVARDAILTSHRLRQAVTVLLAAISLVYVAQALAAAPARWAASMAVAANDPFYARVAEGHGVLLTASDIADVQRRTRRPVLLNGAWIDALPYAPESAAAINRALIAIYGVDLFHPPPDSLDGIGSLPAETGRELWERRSVSEWRDIGRAWHIDQIVTYDDWQLSLPKAATGHGLALFVIPRN